MLINRMIIPDRRLNFESCPIMVRTKLRDMFGRNKAKETNPALRVMNQFGNGTVISGDVNAEGDVRIDGKVTGNVTSKSKVVIGATGIIDGNIFCQNAYI